MAISTSFPHTAAGKFKAPKIDVDQPSSDDAAELPPSECHFNRSTQCPVHTHLSKCFLITVRGVNHVAALQNSGEALANRTRVALRMDAMDTSCIEDGRNGRNDLNDDGEDQEQPDEPLLDKNESGNEHEE